MLHSLVPVTVGMSTMRYRKFMMWTTPACVIWATTYVTFGWLAAGSYRALAQQLHWAGYIFVGVIVLFVVAVWLGKKLLTRREERHWAQPGDGDANTLEAAPEPEAARLAADTED